MLTEYFRVSGPFPPQLPPGVVLEKVICAYSFEITQRSLDYIGNCRVIIKLTILQQQGGHLAHPTDSRVTQLGIGVGGPSSPWGLAGANESWISLQSDSDWSEINFHLKFVPPVPGSPLLETSAGLAPFTIACFYRPRQMSSSNPTQKNVCFLGMYRTKRSLQLLRQCVCMFTIK